jgi:hypothetical protein
VGFFKQTVAAGLLARRPRQVNGVDRVGDIEMTALELAETLDHNWPCSSQRHNQAAAMLRQQANRIEALERELSEVNKPPTGTAPCTRFCEHTAFVVQERMDRATIQQLERENAELRKDAVRYRFIRDADRSDCITPEISLYAMETLDEYVDAAIDGEAAMQKEQS